MLFRSPILSDKCFHCHGADETHRKAKLRLDTFEGAIKKNKKGKSAIVPGDTNKSLLVELIKTLDPDDIMPPEDTGKNLSKEEIDLLTRSEERRVGKECRSRWST